MRVKDGRQTFLGIWVRSLLEGHPIQVFGEGSQVRDFNYVNDCVDAVLAAAESEIADGKVYNLGSSEVISLKDLAEMMTKLGYGGSFELVPFPPERKAIEEQNHGGSCINPSGSYPIRRPSRNNISPTSGSMHWTMNSSSSIPWRRHSW